MKKILLLLAILCLLFASACNLNDESDVTTAETTDKSEVTTVEDITTQEEESTTVEDITTEETTTEFSTTTETALLSPQSMFQFPVKFSPVLSNVTVSASRQATSGVRAIMLLSAQVSRSTFQARSSTSLVRAFMAISSTTSKLTASSIL